MQDTEEIWKDIPGYEGFYQASTLGRIKRLPTIVKHSSGSPGMRRMGGILRQAYGKRFGYYHVSFCANGIKINHRVNVLIAKTFIPNPDNKPQVNHIDHVKTNNRISNLEWVTPSENKIHTIKAGRVKKTHSDGIIDCEKATKIRSLWASGVRQVEIAKIIGTDPSIISRVVNRKRRYKFI
jgi:hypothetical protein